MKRLLFIVLVLSTLGAGEGQHVPSASSAPEKSRIICGGPCNLMQATGYVSVAATRYIMFFNATSLPADGTQAREQIQVAGPSTWGRYGWPEWYGTGIVIACSTTANTLTITASNECTFKVLGQ